MTRDGAIKWAKEIKAFTEGKTIQLFSELHGWVDIEDPIFHTRNKYRIKPEPEPMEFWAALDYFGYPACLYSERPAQIPYGYQLIHVREVT